MDTDREETLSYLRRRAAKVGVLLCACFLILTWRLWNLQVSRGASLTAQAGGEGIRTLPLPAPRGEILDSSGVVLARDSASWEATLSYTAKPLHTAEVNRIADILGIPAGSIEAAAQKLRSGLPFVPVVLAANLTPAQSTILKQDAWELPGVNLVVQPEGIYPGLPNDPNPGNQLAANILGFVRAGTQPGTVVGAAGIEGSYNSRKIAPGLTIGLAGTDGQEIVQINRSSQPIGVLAVRPPVAGDNVVLTINAKDQAVLQRALSDQLAALRTRTFGSDGGPFPQAYGGAAVVIDVRTGQILADASEPTFSPGAFATAAQAPPGSAAQQAFSRQYAAWLAEPGRPFVDHSLSDTAPPGSTFKPITAIAALQGGFITPLQHLPCPASISLGNGYFLHNWIPVFDGYLDLTQAIAFSCDTYFYAVGAKTGITAIDRVATEFGLGQPTGQTDLLGEENPGTLSSPATAMRLAHAAWTPAFTMQTAIGQGFSAFNSVEMADYVAALANGGTLWRPYFVSEVTSGAGKVLWRQQPSVRRRIPLSPAIVQAIRTAMAAVTQNHPSWAAYGPVDTFGTAYWPFYQFTNETAQYLGHAITVAGKTGTAQLGNGVVPDGWFISFAPANNPQIAVVVYTQHSNEGFVGGAPVVREFYDYYFGLDRAMWKAGKAAQIIPPAVQMYFGQNSQLPPWFGPSPMAKAGGATGTKALPAGSGAAAGGASPSSRGRTSTVAAAPGGTGGTPGSTTQAARSATSTTGTAASSRGSVGATAPTSGSATQTARSATAAGGSATSRQSRASAIPATPSGGTAPARATPVRGVSSTTSGAKPAG